MAHLHDLHEGDPVQFSHDGEMTDTDEPTVDSKAAAMGFEVGSGYGPDPKEVSSMVPR